MTSRRTSRTIELPDDIQVRLQKRYGNAKFRPTSLSESFVESDREEDRLRDSGYSVGASGPTQTSKGVDHASQRGDTSWGSDWSSRGTIDEIPPELAVLLWGEARLRDWRADA